MVRAMPLKDMSDCDGITELHEKVWKAEEADGFQWNDPTNSEKQALSIAALKELGSPASVRLLDFGCGNGFFTNFFGSLGYQAHGLDISETVIRNNGRRFPNQTFSVIRPQQPAPFANESFDAIFCSEVIEHVYDVDRLFCEFARLLRPRGLLLLTTPYHGVIKNVVIALFFFERHFNPSGQHIRFWTRKSLARTCGTHGFTSIMWKHVGRVWPVPKSFFVVCRKD